MDKPPGTVSTHIPPMPVASVLFNTSPPHPTPRPGAQRAPLHTCALLRWARRKLKHPTPTTPAKPPPWQEGRRSATTVAAPKSCRARATSLRARRRIPKCTQAETRATEAARSRAGPSKNAAGVPRVQGALLTLVQQVPAASRPAWGLCLAYGVRGQWPHRAQTQ